jgi:hypothetical protein
MPQASPNSSRADRGRPRCRGRRSPDAGDEPLLDAITLGVLLRQEPHDGQPTVRRTVLTAAPLLRHASPGRPLVREIDYHYSARLSPAARRQTRSASDRLTNRLRPAIGRRPASGELAGVQGREAAWWPVVGGRSVADGLTGRERRDRGRHGRGGAPQALYAGTAPPRVPRSGRPRGRRLHGDSRPRPSAGIGGPKASTAAAVMSAVQELDYRPSGVARCCGCVGRGRSG